MPASVLDAKRVGICRLTVLHVLQDGAAHLYATPSSSRRRRTAIEVSDSLYSTSGIA